MRNRRKAVSLLTGLLATAQLSPAAALAADFSKSVLNRAPEYQDFPVYYSDSTHADDQATHPDVIVLGEPWNGYRYQAVYTPNVMRISIYKNSSIVASSNGVHWVEPEGLSNPVEPQPPSTRYHNCDVDMVYNAEYDAMMAYWNWVDDQGGSVGAEVRLWVSYDGVHWGVPVTYDEMTRVWSKPTSDAERQVADGKDDFITAIVSPDRYDMLSSTIIYDDFRDVLILWANNIGDVRYQNGQANFVEMRYSNDGITRGEPVRVNGFLGLDENGQQLASWHQDAQYAPDLKEFVRISQCFAGRNSDDSALHLTTSKDEVNWEQMGTKPLLSPGPDDSWDDFQTYHSSFYCEPGNSVGDGTMRVWYNALQKDTNNKMVADPSGNLTTQAKSEGDRIWRIGYAENSFVRMIRVLLDDPDCTTPALVSGNSLMLSAETTSLPTGDVMKLEANFAPMDTSDQVVKYTSSDSDVATVDELGTITGVSVGSARIMAETREDLSDDLEIAVVENPYTLIPQPNITATTTNVYDGATGGPTSSVLGGNVRTIWYTNHVPKDELPQSITVPFDQPYTVDRFIYTPHQNGTDGIISEYELYVIYRDSSKDLVISGSDWALDAGDKIVSLVPVEAVGPKLKAVAGAGGFGTAAELNVYAYDPIEPAPVYVPVDDRDASLVFTGAWNSDSDGSFYEGTARYTNEIDASIEFTSVGAATRWYGQNDVNFGAAEVYMDSVLAGEVNMYGPAAAQQFLFEAGGLTYGKHTIRIVCVSPVIDFDYLSYAGE